MRILLDKGSPGMRAVRIGEVRELGILRRYPPEGGTRAEEDGPLGVSVEGGGRARAPGGQEDAGRRWLRSPLEAAAAGYLRGWLGTRTILRPTTADTYAILVERYICNHADLEPEVVTRRSRPCREDGLAPGSG
jgi:hypothetical protein